MDRIGAVLQCQWRAYWRRFRRARNLTTNNFGLLVLLGGLGLIKYFQQLPLAVAQLAKGETARYETLLLLAFVVWMLPVMGESRRSITSRDLLHFPLSYRDLFLIRLGSVFFSPASWIIVFCSLALGYPVLLAWHPAAGLAALLLLVLLGLFTSLTISQVLNSAWVRRISLGLLFVSSVAAGVLWLRKQTGALKLVLPHRLAATAAVSATPFRYVAILAGMVVVALFLSLWTFRLSLQPRQHRRSQKSTLFDWLEFPGSFGGLLKKDLRYSGRLLDVYLAVPLVVLFHVYLLSNPAPSAVAFAIVVSLLFLPCLSLAFNCFGLDSPLGLDRYTLFPLSGRKTLASKNLAFGTLMLALFATVLPLTFWKFGTRASVMGLMELILVGLAYLSFGNRLSVRQPFRMQFYRFASGGSPVDALMGVIFGCVPGVVTVYWFYREEYGALWKIALLMLAYLALYLFSLARAARLLERQREAVHRALS